MTSSSHTPCSCHHHHRSHSHHKKHHASKDSKHTKEAPVKAKVVQKAPEAKPPQPKKVEEKPWSLWITAESGRFYYRGRQKPGGDWEYQFLEGYTPPTRKDLSYTPSGATYTRTPPSTESGTTSSSTDNSTNGAGYPFTQGVGAAGLPKAANTPVADAQSDVMGVSETKQKSKVPDVAHKGKGVKVPEKKLKKPAHPKKIGTVVNADKRKKLNPQARIRGWLDDFEPEYE